MNCLICGKPLEDYDPQYCCDGTGCGCMGLPTNPPICSDKCWDACMKYIGIPFEDRAARAGIPQWTSENV